MAEMTEIKLPDSNKTKTIVTIVIAIAVIVIVVFFVKKIMEFFGEDPAVRKSREQSQKDYEKSRDQILNKQKPTMNDAALKLLADQIYECLKYSSLDDNKTEAVSLLKKVNNDADFVRLNDLFGTRDEWWFGINLGSAPFIQYVTSNLSRKQLDEINTTYSAKGITFRW